jgi:SAM-dependent methyltransferase
MPLMSPVIWAGSILRRSPLTADGRSGEGGKVFRNLFRRLRRSSPLAATIPSDARAFEDENATFWLKFSHADLAERCAILHAERRSQAAKSAADVVNAARAVLSNQFIKGNGVELGAGDRPYPLPEGATCYYGDVRDKDGLATYFKNDASPFDGNLDAQSMAGIQDESLDFAISAHVIEHLFDPIGALRSQLRAVKPQGTVIVVVPEMTMTFDRLRTPTPLPHLIRDSEDGGQATKLDAYREHVRYVHPALPENLPPIPEEDMESEAQKIMAAGMDIHVHAWRKPDFAELIGYVCRSFGAEVLATHSVANENIFVLRRLQDVAGHG